MATRSAKNMNGQNSGAKGVLGRMLDSMSAQDFAPGAYSIKGNTKILEAETVSPDMISSGSGAVQFIAAGDGELERHVEKMLQPTSTSKLGETIASLFEGSLKRTKVVGATRSTG